MWMESIRALYSVDIYFALSTRLRSGFDDPKRFRIRKIVCCYVGGMRGWRNWVKQILYSSLIVSEKPPRVTSIFCQVESFSRKLLATSSAVCRVHTHDKGHCASREYLAQIFTTSVIKRRTLPFFFVVTLSLRRPSYEWSVVVYIPRRLRQQQQHPSAYTEGRPTFSDNSAPNCTSVSPASAIIFPLLPLYCNISGCAIWITSDGCYTPRYFREIEIFRRMPVGWDVWRRCCEPLSCSMARLGLMSHTREQTGLGVAH